MICILKMAQTQHPAPEIEGWIIANDLPEARRKAAGAGEHELASELYRMEFDPPPGKYQLKSGHILLVDKTHG